jgi:hypothetical protein
MKKILITSIFLTLFLLPVAAAETTHSQDKFMVKNGQDFRWTIDFDDEFPDGIRNVEVVTPEGIDFEAKEIDDDEIKLFFDVDTQRAGVYTVGVQVIPNNSLRVPVKTYFTSVALEVPEMELIEHMNSYFKEKINDTRDDLESQMSTIKNKNQKLRDRIDALENETARIEDLEERVKILENKIKEEKEESGSITGLITSQGSLIAGIAILITIGVYIVYKKYYSEGGEEEEFHFSPE